MRFGDHDILTTQIILAVLIVVCVMFVWAVVRLNIRFYRQGGRRAVVAFVLSLLLPGLGLGYIGKWKWGLVNICMFFPIASPGVAIFIRSMFGSLDEELPRDVASLLARTYGSLDGWVFYGCHLLFVVASGVVAAVAAVRMEPDEV